MGSSTLQQDQQNAVDRSDDYSLQKKYDSKYPRSSVSSSAYDQVRPKNESAIINYLRSWEKHFGLQTPLIYKNAVSLIIMQILGAICLLSMFSKNSPMWQTTLFAMVMGSVAAFGVTAGVHRYWCHRSYKAKLPLQIILMLCYSVAGQNTIFDWVRDHRVHHKFSETAADPHDAHRGFWFAHIGWLLMRKHPEVIRRGNQVDMSDIVNDPVVKIHTKYFTPLKVMCCFVLPTLVPPLAWGESWWHAVTSQVFVRYVLSLNFTWSVNSFAHLFGYKPYDGTIMPAENWIVSIVAFGEGWHNYHHTFPWDYKAAELPYSFNATTVFLELFRAIGWVYDTKEASEDLIRATTERKGERKT